MKLVCYKIQNKLVPCDGFNLDNLNEGSDYEIEVKKTRNLKFHRKFWGLFNQFYDAVSPDYSIEAMREIITIKAGFYERIVTKKGVHYISKSISFSKMDEIEFNDFYRKFNASLLEEYGCNLDDIEYN
jgi:hypothetical protein